MSRGINTDPEALLHNNRVWAKHVEQQDPGFFERLAHQQQPHYLWIGCSDSRVPANQITGLPPGEVFVHRNIANVVSPDDPNCLAVLEFAVTVLEVRHIIVCGHYGCGGVQAAMQGNAPRRVQDWLRDIRNLNSAHQGELAAYDEPTAFARLCELNVRHQVQTLCGTPILREAWANGQTLSVHGWIYSIRDGLLHDLDTRVDSLEDLHALNAG